MSNTVRWGGLAAMLGGALLVVSALLIASMPRGCIGDECATRPMRDTGIVGALLMLAVLLVVGTLAMPFGIAWVAVGYVLWSDKSSPVRRTRPVK
jgi:hypothetical protein